MSPLVSPGPRSRVWISRKAAATATRIAYLFGLTQRKLMDKVLEDTDLLNTAAQRLAIRGPARARNNPRAQNPRKTLKPLKPAVAGS